MKKYRLDLTVGFGGSGPKRGAKFGHQDAFAVDLYFRFTQRFTYVLDEGGYGSSRLVLNMALRDRDLMQAYTRFLYGEKTGGIEWFSNLSYGRGRGGNSGRVVATGL